MTTRTGSTTLIRQTAVFDGTRLQPAQDVLIDGPVITAVGTHLETPAGATGLYGTGRTLLPSPIDAHTHTSDTAQLRQALVHGITTELDIGWLCRNGRRMLPPPMSGTTWPT